MRTRRLPPDDDQCGWLRLLPPLPPPRRLEREETADAVVVGAGFTGLAAARRLALRRPAWRVALVDAGRAGSGASSRNSGFAGDIAHRDPSLGVAGTMRLRRLCRAGISWLRSIVEERGIDCAWAECGRLHAAVEAHSLANLAGLRGVLEAIGEPCRPMGKDDLARAIGTRYYRAGIHIGTTVLLQPAALVRGLASTLPANVDLFEQSPVHAIERRHGWTIRAGSGGLCTERVFLAVNGFAPALGVLRQRIFPLHTFASLTRVLDAGEQASAGEWRQWGLVSEDRMGSSLRRTADQRILVRNSVRYLPSLALSTHLLARIRERHRRSLVARWPALRDVELEFTWGGVLGMTANQGQFFGRLAEGLYASIGYNGTGVALGTASGMLLADHALGIDSELLRDALALPRPAWIPPEPLLGLGLRPALALLERRAGAEL